MAVPATEDQKLKLAMDESTSLITTASTTFFPTEPNSLAEAMQHAGWRNAMKEEYCALNSNGTWDLVPAPPNANWIG
jgi:hypothetical protein